MVTWTSLSIVLNGTHRGMPTAKSAVSFDTGKYRAGPISELDELERGPCLSIRFFSSSPPLIFICETMAALLLPQSSTVVPLITAPKLCTATSSSFLLFRKRFARINSCKRSQLWRVSAVAEEALSSEPALIENAQQVVPSGSTDDISPTIVSALLLIAFVGLSILTVGVIYLAVTDFLQKREREKFDKEEAAKKKKTGKKGKVKARAGPRGFGQKVEEEGDDNDN